MSGWNSFCNDQNDQNDYNMSIICQNETLMKRFEYRRDENEKRKHAIVDKPQPSHITCDNCGSNLIWISVRQLRSADEGATMSCKCFDCKQKWTSN